MVLRTMALSPGFARAVDKAVAAALAAQQKRINQMFKVGAMSEVEWEAERSEIEAQRARLTVKPAPLFARQQSALRTLVDEWNGMTADERKRMLAAIFDSVTAGADGVDRLEHCEDWRPYVVAAIPKPVRLPADARASTERKTGVKHAEVITARLVQDDCGWLTLAR